MKKTIILSAALTLGMLTANSQVQYTDLTPDSVISISGSTFTEIDVNQDGYTDFDFDINGFTGMYGLIISSLDGEVVVNNLASNPNSSYVSTMFSGDAITPSYKWADYTRNIRIDDQTKDNFRGNGELFIGFRLEDGGDYYYGWFLVELTSGLTFSVKSFAIETSPNTPITAGNTGSGMISLAEAANKTLAIYPTMVTDKLNVELPQAMKQVEVYDLAGNLVYYKALQPENMDIFINTTNFKSGVYVLAITDEAGHKNISKFVK